ncbi:MAG: hypothetical protein RKE49_10330 [Oceanicaulis sp.]
MIAIAALFASLLVANPAGAERHPDEVETAERCLSLAFIDGGPESSEAEREAAVLRQLDWSAYAFEEGASEDERARRLMAIAALEMRRRDSMLEALGESGARDQLASEREFCAEMIQVLQQGGRIRFGEQEELN